MIPWRMLLACAALAFAGAAQPATITGRVFDVYHRPVRAARVATMEQQLVRGKQRLIPGAQTTVDDAGMYRLPLPAGRYVLAVLPPRYAMDHATVFPAYLNDNVDFAKTQPIEVTAGELRPFTDFLLLEVESHRLAGQVEGVPKGWGTVGVLLKSETGYTEPLRAVEADSRGRFVFDHIPAGSYELNAVGPVVGVMALRPFLGTPAQSGAVHIEVAAPDVSGIQIHLHPAPR
jgi:hypothetical protein